MLRVTFKPFTARVVRIRQHGDGAYYFNSVFDLRRLSLKMLQEIWDNFQPIGAKEEDVVRVLTPEDALDRVASLLAAHLTPPTTQEHETMSKEKAAKAAKAAKAETDKVAAAHAPSAEQVTARRTQLETEITEATVAYKAYVTERKTELKTLGKGPRAERAPSERIQKTVAMLQAPEGATKTQLADATGAAKGYVAALISRILGEKGYTLSATKVEGQAEKVYRITDGPTAAAA